MKTSLSPSPSQNSLNNNTFVNPFSKSETEGTKRSSVSVSPARSPMTKKKGPIVKTVKKKSNTDDNGEADQKNEETKSKGTKRTSLMKRNETYTKKNLEHSDEKEPKKTSTTSNGKGKLSVESVGKQKNKVRSPSLNKRKVEAKTSTTKTDKEDVKPCTNITETKKPGKSKSTSVSSVQSNPRKKDKSLNKEEVETKKPGESNPPSVSQSISRKKDKTFEKEEVEAKKTSKTLNKGQDKLSPASKEKMEVKGKKMKTPKMPPPLSDKEKFDLLFEAYSKWGTDEAPDKGISAYQLTRWLKNVELLEGKKVLLV